MNKNKYNYYVINIGEDGENAYKAIIPKFENIHIYADTIGELHELVQDCIEMNIKDLKKEGKPIPKPDKTSKFNGKILLRVNPDLHEKLFHEARANQVSLNKYIEGKLNN